MFDHRLARVMYQDQIKDAGKKRGSDASESDSVDRGRRSLATVVALLVSIALFLGLSASYFSALFS